MTGNSAMKGKYYHNQFSLARKMLKDELEVLKSDVREAYSISAQINLGKGFEPSERDLKLVEEQALNLKLIERLEKMRNDLSENKNTEKKDRVLIEKTIPFDSQTMLHFFYIVRLAQQGFFHLIQGVHPALEYQAVQYVCDTLISYSIRNTRSNHVNERAACTEVIWNLYNGLMEEKDEPVGKGFKTTFKDIMNAAHCLIDKSIHQQQDNNTPTANTNTPPHPVWFVMPYTSMMDTLSFNLPGTMPTLPFPSEYMSSNVHSQNTPKRQNNHRNNNRKNDKSEQKVEKKVEEDKKNSNQSTIENDKEEEEEDTKESGSDEEDRFADPDMSDEEQESEKEDNSAELVKKEETPVTTTTTTTLNNDQNDSSSVDGSEVAKANSSWLNFAASSTPPETPSNHSSPKRSNSQGYKNY